MAARDFYYHNPSKVHFGRNKMDLLSTLELPGKKALIIVTPERFFVERAQKLLSENKIESVVFDQVRPNPSIANVVAAAKMAKDNGCDFLISIGGGSSTDTTKAVSVLVTNGGNPWEYVKDPSKIKNRPIPFVAISTTSGTGTEVDQGAVLTNDETQEKADIFTDLIFPTLSIVDPCLQTTLPKALTAFQGMDVIYHSSEGFISKFASAMGDVYALESIRLAAKSLPIAYWDGTNIDAREDMALASMLAGFNESCTGTASLHGIAHAFGAMHPIPHGCALSLVAVECFKHYAKNVPGRLAVLSNLVGYGTEPEGYAQFIEDMLRKIEFDKVDFRTYGVDPKLAEDYAKKAYASVPGYFECDMQPMPFEVCVEIIKKSLGA